MRTSLTKDSQTGLIKISYPFIPEADDQANNYHQVRAIQTNIEKRVRKDGWVKEYDEEMRRMLTAGVVIKLGEKDLKVYRGGIHYMPHFPILNPESKSTKLRIVVDSKCKTLPRGSRSTT